MRGSPHRGALGDRAFAKPCATDVPPPQNPAGHSLAASPLEPDPLPPGGRRFTQLFEVYQQTVDAAAFAVLRSRADAEDVVQEVFLRLWRLERQLPDRKFNRSYFRQAARNEALHTLARQRRAVALNDSLRQREGSPTASAEQQFDDDRLQLIIDRAIQTLPPHCRQIMRMIVVNGMTTVDVASALGIRAKAVEKQRTRGRRLIRKALPLWLCPHIRTNRTERTPLFDCDGGETPS
jgi:RNA polymerase sigma-70 factor (ECF subfamily)